jgi:hypothetical protein
VESRYYLSWTVDVEDARVPLGFYPAPEVVLEDGVSSYVAVYEEPGCERALVHVKAASDVHARLATLYDEVTP